MSITLNFKWSKTDGHKAEGFWSPEGAYLCEEGLLDFGLRFEPFPLDGDDVTLTVGKGKLKGGTYVGLSPFRNLEYYLPGQVGQYGFRVLALQAKLVQIVSKAIGIKPGDKFYVRVEYCQGPGHHDD